MLRRNRQIPSLADGVADFYRETALPSSFGAKTNQSDPAQMEFLARLHYSLASCREEDYQSAERIGYALSMRIRTYAVAGIRQGDKAVVDGMLYDIQELDTSTRPWCWWSLSGGTPVPEPANGGGEDG